MLLLCLTTYRLKIVNISCYLIIETVILLKILMEARWIIAVIKLKPYFICDNIYFNVLTTCRNSPSVKREEEESFSGRWLYSCTTSSLYCRSALLYIHDFYIFLAWLCTVCTKPPSIQRTGALLCTVSVTRRRCLRRGRCRRCCRAGASRRGRRGGRPPAPSPPERQRRLRR